MAGSPALPELSGANYARTHAAYEAASDQRAGLQAWLPRELPSLLGAGPLQVLGVGVGDGSIDAPLAAALAADGREVGYTGVEPHAASAAGFAARLVHFVHSLYYMADLRATLDQALAMLRPGGLLVAATAPREPLCVLTDLLSPAPGIDCGAPRTSPRSWSRGGWCCSRRRWWLDWISAMYISTHTVWGSWCLISSSARARP